MVWAVTYHSSVYHRLISTSRVASSHHFIAILMSIGILACPDRAENGVVQRMLSMHMTSKFRWIASSIL